MIIKLTFKDNDFTPLLENYTNKIFDIGYYNSINEYSEFKRKIYKYESDNLSEKEKQQLKKTNRKSAHNKLQKIHKFTQKSRIPYKITRNKNSRNNNR